MIRQTFTLRGYDWKVYVYYCISFIPIEEIMNVILELNVDKRFATRAYTMLESHENNQGFTYSDESSNTSVVFIGPADNATQFFNTFLHEANHLARHISKSYNIPIDSEEASYLLGDIAGTMFSKCKSLMCDCCRNK